MHRMPLRLAFYTETGGSSLEIKTEYELSMFASRFVVSHFPEATILHARQIHCSEFAVGTSFMFAVYDAENKHVEPSAFLCMAHSAHSKRRQLTTSRHRHKQIMPSFRHGPVPHTGKKGGGGILRYPRTKQERTNVAGVCNDAYIDQLPIKIRAARNLRLPTSWDDIMRGDLNHRSWKRSRRTQWKPKSLS